MPVPTLEGVRRQTADLGALGARIPSRRLYTVSFGVPMNPLVVLVLTMSGPASAATLSVGPAQTYTTISDALVAAVAGDVIEVEAGDYAENLYVDVDVDIVGLGGSGATSISAPSGTAIIVSGSTASLTGFTVNPTSNRGMQVSAGADFSGQDLVFSGFITYDDEGSGLAGGYSTVSLTDCVFDDLETWPLQDGAAIALNDSTIAFSRVAVTNSRPGEDGAVKLLRVDGTIDDSWFEGNHAGGKGGAVMLEDSAVTITNSTFLDNVADSAGGALVFNGGDIVATGNTFCGNRAIQHGGAVAMSGVGTVDNHWSGNLFVDNEAVAEGGGIWASGGVGPSLIDNTFVGNIATDGGHFRGVGNAPVLANDIFAYAVAGNGISQDTTAGSRDYNLFWSNVGADTGGALGAGDLGANSVFADPMFLAWSADADCTNDDFGLDPLSPAIDAGDPAYPDPGGSPGDIGATSDQVATTTPGTATGTGTGTSTGTATGSTPTGTSTGATGTGTGDPAQPDDAKSGCGCSTGSPSSNGWVLIGALLVARHRRRSWHVVRPREPRCPPTCRSSSRTRTEPAPSSP